MTRELAAIMLVNLLMALFGLGMMLLLGIARTPRQLLVRSPLAYALGLAATGLVGSALELAGAPLGELGLTVLAVGSLAGGGFKLLALPEPPDEPHSRPSLVSVGVGLASVAFAIALVLHAGRAYAVRPLREWDGWVIWGTKARALYTHGGVDEAVFTGTAYEHPDYPILLPTLEAIGFRALGRFDGTYLHLQLAGLALAFAAAAWTISRASASPAVSGLAILAALSAPSVLIQLGWNYADVPMAMLCALGAAALAAWLRGEATWPLASAVVFLAAGATTKSEGVMFALAAFASALVVVAVSRRERLVPLFVAGGAFVLAILPWRLYVAVHGVSPQDYELANLADPGYLADVPGRVPLAAAELVEEMTRTSSWGLVLPLAGVAMLTALLRRRFDVAGFAALWLAGSFAGLLLVYWINELPLGEDLFNSSYRTIATLMLGSALLVPQLVDRGLRRDPGGSKELSHERRGLGRL